MTDEVVSDLKRSIERDEVLVVVGAGVSMQASGGSAYVDGKNVASWLGLLEHGLDRCREDLGEDRYETARRLVAERDLPGVADRITSTLLKHSEGAYRRWLTDTVGALVPERPQVLEAVLALGVPIATTNYDGLIERAAKDGRQALTWRQGSAWQAMFRGEEREKKGNREVLHLHGYWGVPDSVVLGLSSYEDLRRDEPAQAMLRAVSLMKSLLFVGCGEGLDDPNWGALRDWLSRVASDSEHRHFRLVRSGEEYAAGKDHKADRIEPVAYGADFGDLAPFLRSLIPPETVGISISGDRILEIDIGKEGVLARTQPEGVTAKGPLTLTDPLRLATVHMLEEWLRLREDFDPGSDEQSETALREAVLLGRILFDSVFTGPEPGSDSVSVRELYDRELRAVLASNGRLSVILKVRPDRLPLLYEEDPPYSLAALPWELLHAPDGPLAKHKDITLSRALPGNTSAPWKAEPLRVLVVNAQPQDLLADTQKSWSTEKWQRYEEALEDIQRCLRSLKDDNPAVDAVEVLAPASKTALLERLKAAEPPSIVHFIGFGSLKWSQEQEVALVRPDGSAAHWLANKEFADLFLEADQPPRLVFLHLCEGPRESQTAGYDFVRASFSQLARRLLGSNVQMVVASNYSGAPGQCA